MKFPTRCVAVISGGMDSATLLWHLVRNGAEVAALSVYYGQRHSRELDAAKALCAELGVFHEVVNLHGLKSVMVGSSQTDDSIPVPEGHYEDKSMRKTVVPNRNMILLSVAGAMAVSMKMDCIAYGAHAGDHAIYHDCRPAFVEAMNKPMALCDYAPLYVYAPFLNMTKGDIAMLGENLGVPYDLTWTCYKGEQVHCGKCGACQERVEAFKATNLGDPVEFAA